MNEYYSRHPNEDASSRDESPRPSYKSKHATEDVLVEGTLQANKGFFTEEVCTASLYSSGDMHVGGSATVEGSAVLKGKTQVSNVVVEDDLRVFGNATLEKSLTVHEELIVEKAGTLKLEGRLESSSSAVFERDIRTHHDMNVEGSLQVHRDADVCGDLMVDGCVEIGETLHCAANIGACGIIASKVMKTDKVHSRYLVNTSMPVTWVTHPPETQCCILASSVSAILFELYLCSPGISTELQQYEIHFNLGCVSPAVKGMCVLGFDSDSQLKQDAFANYASCIRVQDNEATASVQLTRLNNQDGEHDTVKLSLIISWVE